MSFSPTLSKLNRHISSLLGDPPNLGRDPWKGLAILAALGGYLANKLIVHPAPSDAMRNPERGHDPSAEEAVAALIRAIERASRDADALAELQTWAIGIHAGRRLPPSDKPRLAAQGQDRLAHRYRRLLRTAASGEKPATACILRGLAFGARTLGAMGWLPTHLGLSLALACETVANRGNRGLHDQRPSLGLPPRVLH